ncbi:histidine phosphatase family protein [Paenibacillus sp. PR3]|uniref:Histidine phosphatase family protein n=1 Tax=Paenibacillus terricola TaxID=2763503 RepID=A0ABR8MWM1_9BACL|nr:histidine phosphatase family protein [Paenibacillus terricola]MBD3919461.1 histidine phosphatase family protein [Paenibacillus terricola]
MIYVVRHGQTDWNREGKLQGRQGLPLNELGISQAEHLRVTLQDVKFDYVFSSPQARAIETAEIATGLKAIVDDRLDVFDLGDADGLTRNEVKLDGVVPDSNFYNGVEDIRAFIARVFNFMRELDAQHRNEELNILISGHRCTTGCIGAYFEGIPEDGNILTHSSDNGGFKSYEFTTNIQARQS